MFKSNNILPIFGSISISILISYFFTIILISGFIAENFRSPSYAYVIFQLSLLIIFTFALLKIKSPTFIKILNGIGLVTIILAAIAFLSFGLYLFVSPNK